MGSGNLHLYICEQGRSCELKKIIKGEKEYNKNEFIRGGQQLMRMRDREIRRRRHRKEKRLKQLLKEKLAAAKAAKTRRREAEPIAGATATVESPDRAIRSEAIPEEKKVKTDRKTSRKKTAKDAIPGEKPLAAKKTARSRKGAKKTEEE